MAAHCDPLAPKKRLDSWKEIAAFFGRDERTVKRWEKERGLPVCRVPGSARGGVFAYAEELAEWLKAPNATSDIAETEATPADEGADAATPANLLVIKTPTGVRAPLSTTGLHVPASSRMAAARPFLWLAPLVVIAGSFLALSFGHREPRFRNALAAPHAPSAEAQDLYLKGRYYFEKRTPDDLNKAVDFFTQAIVHDPGYAGPYVGLADTYNLLREYSAMLPEEAFPRARAAASKAVELDPNSAEAHNSLAFASFWGFLDVATADREFRRALELDPGLARAHHWHATFLIEIGRTREARKSSKPGGWTRLRHPSSPIRDSSLPQQKKQKRPGRCSRNSQFPSPTSSLRTGIWLKRSTFQKAITRATSEKKRSWRVCAMMPMQRKTLTWKKKAIQTTVCGGCLRRGLSPPKNCSRTALGQLLTWPLFTQA